MNNEKAATFEDVSTEEFLVQTAASANDYLISGEHHKDEYDKCLLDITNKGAKFTVNSRGVINDVTYNGRCVYTMGGSEEALIDVYLGAKSLESNNFLWHSVYTTLWDRFMEIVSSTLTYMGYDDASLAIDENLFSDMWHKRWIDLEERCPQLSECEIRGCEMFGGNPFEDTFFDDKFIDDVLKQVKENIELVSNSMPLPNKDGDNNG